MKDVLEIEDADDIEFQRVRRMGKPKKDGHGSRTIIARSLRFPDRERVFKCGRKLKGTDYKMYEDIPKELHELRKKQLDKLKKADLSLYEKVTIIKSLLIPKFVYIFSLLPVPKRIIQELNRLLFKFLWKGTDKVTRLSTINEYENGGLKMIDLESMIKSLRLAWMKRIFGKNDGAWKSYLRFSLQFFVGLFLFYCNYDIKDHSKPSLFYSELLQWWS